MRARGALSFLAVTLAPAVARADDVPDLGKLAALIRWSGVVASIPLLLGAMLLIRMVERTGDRLAARFPNRRPTVQKVQTSLRFLLYIAAFSLAIGLSFRLDSTSLAVIGGSLAVAVGFALRDLVASFVAGITIMFDRPFQVGDRVTYGGEYGDVIKIGLRSVRLLTLDHNFVTIPNNRVLTDVTVSSNYAALEMQVPIDFYIGMDQDADLAIVIIREACLTSPYVFLAHPVVVEVRQVSFEQMTALRLKARPYVFNCKYERDFETDVHLRVLEGFRKHGITAPRAMV